MDLDAIKQWLAETVQKPQVKAVPSLKRGRVWCHACGHTEAVYAAAALSHGWPQHCGRTMSIDSPDERQQSQR